MTLIHPCTSFQSIIMLNDKCVGVEDKFKQILTLNILKLII